MKMTTKKTRCQLFWDGIIAGMCMQDFKGKYIVIYHWCNECDSMIRTVEKEDDRKDTP